MDIGGLDTTSWPIWVLAILMVVNIFKEPIGAFLPQAAHNFFRHRAKKSDREQQRKSWREEQWIELVQKWDAFAQGTLAQELKSIRSTEQTSCEELAKLRNGIERVAEKLDAALDASQDTAKALNRILAETKRTGNILTTIHIALSQMAEVRRDDG
jgi:hypothetical protein